VKSSCSFIIISLLCNELEFSGDRKMASALFMSLLSLLLAAIIPPFLFWFSLPPKVSGDPGLNPETYTSLPLGWFFNGSDPPPLAWRPWITPWDKTCGTFYPWMFLGFSSLLKCYWKRAWSNWDERTFLNFGEASRLGLRMSTAESFTLPSDGWLSITTSRALIFFCCALVRFFM